MVPVSRLSRPRHGAQRTPPGPTTDMHSLSLWEEDGPVNRAVLQSAVVSPSYDADGLLLTHSDSTTVADGTWIMFCYGSTNSSAWNLNHKLSCIVVLSTILGLARVTVCTQSCNSCIFHGHNSHCNSFHKDIPRIHQEDDTGTGRLVQSWHDIIEESRYSSLFLLLVNSVVITRLNSFFHTMLHSTSHNSFAMWQGEAGTRIPASTTFTS